VHNACPFFTFGRSTIYIHEEESNYFVNHSGHPHTKDIFDIESLHRDMSGKARHILESSDEEGPEDMDDFAFEDEVHATLRRLDPPMNTVLRDLSLEAAAKAAEEAAEAALKGCVAVESIISETVLLIPVFAIEFRQEQVAKKKRQLRLIRAQRQLQDKVIQKASKEAQTKVRKRQRRARQKRRGKQQLRKLNAISASKKSRLRHTQSILAEHSLYEAERLRGVWKPVLDMLQTKGSQKLKLKNQRALKAFVDDVIKHQLQVPAEFNTIFRNQNKKHEAEEKAVKSARTPRSPRMREKDFAAWKRRKRMQEKLSKLEERWPESVERVRLPFSCATGVDHEWVLWRPLKQSPRAQHSRGPFSRTQAKDEKSCVTSDLGSKARDSKSASLRKKSCRLMRKKPYRSIRKKPCRSMGKR
jgi:hypothetical protein